MITTNLRFPEKELHKAITESAKKNRRSLNAEILRAIEYYLENNTEAQENKVIKKPKDKQA